MRLQWFLNCNAHLKLKMFTEAIVLLNQCASIWIFMVYFEGSFSLFCILYYSLFVLSFRRLCTGIIDFCSRYELHKSRVWFHWFLYILHSAQCAPGCECVKCFLPPRCQVTCPPSNVSLPCLSNLCPLCVYYGNYCIFLKVFFSIE